MPHKFFPRTDLVNEFFLLGITCSHKLQVFRLLHRPVGSKKFPQTRSDQNTHSLEGGGNLCVSDEIPTLQTGFHRQRTTFMDILRTKNHHQGSCLLVQDIPVPQWKGFRKRFRQANGVPGFEVGIGVRVWVRIALTLRTLPGVTVELDSHSMYR